MPDPSSYITAKVAAAIGGLLGGAGMMSFIKPNSIGEAFARGGVSTGTAIIFSNPVIVWLGAPDNWEMQLMAGGVIGFVAYSLLGAVANFFHKNKGDDIFELAAKAKKGAKNGG